jgi:N-methylhydantoinase A
MGYRVGIDVGGTFTDFVAVEPDGSFSLWKGLTTPEDPSIGVAKGLERLAADRGFGLADLLRRTDLVVHGTTTADNTMIDLSGARTGLLVTRGRRDEIELRRGYKEDIWNPRAAPPPTLVPRRYRLPLAERLDCEGRVLVPLDEEEVRAAVRRLRGAGIESVAVVLLFSFLNPAHERRVGEIVREEWPDLRMLSLSHEVHPAAPEFERTSTTVVNAYVGPRVERYLRRLEELLHENGFPHPLFVMQSNGGIATVDSVSRRPVATLASGPAGGVIGACHVAREAGIEDFISVDMGGTSYDVCLVRGAEPVVKSAWNWVHRYLVALPMVDVVQIGAGGGSIARAAGGTLQVGPQSAGSEPGPICFGRGGREPTVTDAHLVLGYLNPRSFAGGEMALRVEGVAEAIEEKVGRPLGMGAVEAAAGIYRLANANMNHAIARVSAQRGHDPRRFALVVFGGNGPVHALAQAEELGIGRVLVPRTAPAFSALGLLGAGYLVDRIHARIEPAAAADPARLAALFGELEAAAAAEIAAAGLPPERVVHERFAQCRYPGQTFDLDVPVAGGALGAAAGAAIAEGFHARHQAEHGFARRAEEVWIAGLRVRTRAPLDRPALPRHPGAGGAPARPAATRPAHFGGRFLETAVYAGRELRAGHGVAGPAIIEEPFTTLVVPPGWGARLDDFGNYLATRGAAGGGPA